MTGREISARDRLGAGIPIAAVIALLFAWITIADDRDRHIGVAMIALPVAFIVVRLARRLPPVRFRVGENRIERLDRPGEIPFPDIEAVTADGYRLGKTSFAAGRSPIELRYRGGELVIPPAISGTGAAELYAYLQSLAPDVEAPLPPELKAHADAQLERFGSEKVHAFGSPALGRRRYRGRGTRCMAMATAIWSVLCLVVGLAKPEFDALAWMGGFGLAFAFLFWLIGLARAGGDPATKKQSGGGIVISPIGIALKQGSLTGELKWEEIRGIQSFKPAAVRVTNRNPHRGIKLQLEGTEVVIADLYDAPQEAIEGLLLTYWRPPSS